MMKKLLLITATLLIIGCSSKNTTSAPAPYLGYKDDLNDYLSNQEKEKASASLFSKEKGDKLFVGYRSKLLGDIVVVKIVENSKATNSSNTNTSKSSSYDSSISAILGLPIDLGMGDFLGSGNSFDPSIRATTNNSFKGGGNKAKNDSISATIAARIIEILPNGNVVIEGRREIVVDQEKQLITLRGIVREKDIAADNTVLSSSIAEAQITYSGDGVITDANTKGWLTTFIDWIWPF